MKTRAALLILVLFLLLTAGCGQQAAPEGTPRMCVSCGDGRLLLLYSQQAPAQGKKPVRQDTIWLYQPEKDRYSQVFSAENLWDGPDCQLALAGERVLFHNGEGRLFAYDPAGDGWRITDLTQSLEQPYVLSPDGTKYAIRQEDGIALTGLSSGEALGALAAQDPDQADFRAMRWDGDGRRLAVVTGDGLGVTLWDTESGEIRVFRAYEDFSPPEGWVDMIDARPAGNYLLMQYLCETGAAMVIYDLGNQAEYAAPFWEGEMVLLDIRGEDFLLEHIPPEGPHTLNLYRCPLRESRRLEELDGVYTAACFAGNGKAFFCRYDPKTQKSQLEETSYDH